MTRKAKEDPDGAGAEFPSAVEYAVAILEDLPAAALLLGGQEERGGLG